MPRLWFVNSDDTELVQFQADRSVHNWRKVASNNSEYPRYEVIKDRFFKELRLLNGFLDQESIGNIEPNQCEVTYVNHIMTNDNNNIWNRPDMALRILLHTSGNDSDRAARLPRMEDTRHSARYVIENSEGGPLGRLIVTSQPAIGADQRPVLRLDLTARGAPAEATFDAVSNFFDVGRETIVRGFTAITTPDMHKRWHRVK